MSTETDLVMERRRQRRGALLWKVLTALAVTALIAVLVSGDPAKFLGAGAEGVAFDGERVARIEINGLIIEDRWRSKMIKDLTDDEKVRAVIVTINSPGGTVVGGEDLYKGLRALAEKKPVVAVMGSSATSAAYMTAIGTERIFAREGTLTGSIGVILQTTNVAGLLEKLGVEPIIVRSGPYKAKPNFVEPLSDEARKHVEGLILDMHDMFVDMVAQRREFSREAALELADGRVFTGRQALKLGLIDAIGGEEEAKAWLSAIKGLDADLPVVLAQPDYPQQALVQRLLGASAEEFGKALLSERVTLDGLLAVWHPEL